MRLLRHLLKWEFSHIYQLGRMEMESCRGYIKEIIGSSTVDFYLACTVHVMQHYIDRSQLQHEKESISVITTFY